MSAGLAAPETKVARPGEVSSSSRAARWRRRRDVRYPRALAIAAGIVGLALLVPLAFLALQAKNVGWANLSHGIFRSRDGFLLWNTVRLMVLVTAACAVIGVGAAYAVERTNVAFRRTFRVLVVLPLAIPDFVVAYAWSSLAPSFAGYFAAGLVMSLSLYPLVYLPVAASLRRSDAALDEAARSLGYSRTKVFFKVTLPHLRVAIFGGCLVVALAMLAEYGAFEILRFQTFTTEIFTEFDLSFDPATASALSIVLVALGVLVLVAELLLTGRRRVARIGPGTSRPSARVELGRRAPFVLVPLVVLVGAALGVPIATLCYWLVVGQSTTLPSASMFSALLHTVLYAGVAGALATVLAIPVAVLVVRHRGRFSVLLERLAFITQSLPGLVIALALVFFSIRYFLAFYESPEELVAAYVALFFPLALVGVRAAVAHAPARIEEVARSLGRGPVRAFCAVTLPIVAPGIAAAFALVFLSSTTELTATLLLHPTGVETLATQFWAYETNLAYGAAAPYAAAIVAIAAVPTYLLGRWFDARSQTPAGDALGTELEVAR